MDARFLLVSQNEFRHHKHDRACDAKTLVTKKKETGNKVRHARNDR